MKEKRNAFVVISVLLGGLVGIGGFTFIYADGASYLSAEADACANCHVMRDQFEAWQKSSHRQVAACNDCHAPHSSAMAKLAVKGINGFNHSLAFTTGRFPEPIRITEFNRRVTEEACRHCHEPMVHTIDRVPSEDALSCIRCHVDVGHLH